MLTEIRIWTRTVVLAILPSVQKISLAEGVISGRAISVRIINKQMSNCNMIVSPVPVPRIISGDCSCCIIVADNDAEMTVKKWINSSTRKSFLQQKIRILDLTRYVHFCALTRHACRSPQSQPTPSREYLALPDPATHVNKNKAD